MNELAAYFCGGGIFITGFTLTILNNIGTSIILGFFGGAATVAGKLLIEFIAKRLKKIGEGDEEQLKKKTFEKDNPPDNQRV